MSDPATEVPLQDPDETRPAKRVRLEAPLSTTTDTLNEMDGDMEDDWDVIYGANSPAKLANTAQPTADASISAPLPMPDLTSQSADAEALPSHLAAPVCDNDTDTISLNEQERDLPDGAPAEAISIGDDLVAPPEQTVLEPQEERVFEETTQIEREALPTQREGETTKEQLSTSGDVPMLDIRGLMERPTKTVQDPEFLAAAAVQKGEKNAEWQYDTSDADSSDSDTSSDSSDSDSDSGSDEGYELLDPATAAKILMSGDADDDEGGKTKGASGAKNGPRTANEVKEEVVNKPDITITPTTKITFLGSVEQAVENLVLIKGATTGEYHVLESGSVLCNEARQIIGTVADTFGRVQQPLYSVQFNNSKEVEEANLQHQSKVFYVDEHSTFVFTQPLRNLKGTDASNVHDEEVGEDEQEFSDDEKEAEYKRQKKQAKKAGKEGLSRGAFVESRNNGHGYDKEPSFVTGSDAPTQAYGGGMTYDDDEPAEQFYAPLKRPDNLSELMSGGIPLPPKPQNAPTFDRGRGRARGDRGRGDRGRGRGDRGRGRGGVQGSFRGRGNTTAHQESRTNMGNIPASSPYAPSSAQYQPPAQFHQQAPQTYHSNGYQFQYGNQPAAAPAPQYNYYQQQSQAQPSAPVPPGSYVNPNSNYYQQQYQQPQAYYPPYNTQQQQYSQNLAGMPQQPQQQPQVPDINAILHNMGHPQRPR